MRGKRTNRCLVLFGLTFEMYLLDGLSDALLFALEVGDVGVLELKPVLLVGLQGQFLGPGNKTQVIVGSMEITVQSLCVWFNQLYL